MTEELGLHNLRPNPGSTKATKRLGRGKGTGQGKTAGKGHKGKQARSGSGKGAGFEGGQMPLIRRLPKFGFSNERNKIAKAAVTLEHLENKFDDGATVDFEALVGKKLISKNTEYVKVLATGTLSKKLTVKIHGFSAKAKEAIEAAGGSCETV
jgi:large subunit ribosomal protein L15